MPSPRILLVSIILLLTLAIITTAQAAPVLWTLDAPVALSTSSILHPAGMLTGSFVYDASTDMFSDVRIVASGGTGGDGTYEEATSASNSGILVALMMSPLNADDTRVVLDWFSGLRDAGGQRFGRSTRTSARVERCGVVSGGVCSSLSTLARSNGVPWTLTGSPVPAPSSMFLFGSGLVGLIGWRWWSTKTA